MNHEEFYEEVISETNNAPLVALADKHFSHVYAVMSYLEKKGQTLDEIGRLDNELKDLIESGKDPREATFEVIKKACDNYVDNFDPEIHRIEKEDSFVRREIVRTLKSNVLRKDITNDHTESKFNFLKNKVLSVSQNKSVEDDRFFNINERIIAGDFDTNFKEAAVKLERLFHSEEFKDLTDYDSIVNSNYNQQRLKKQQINNMDILSNVKGNKQSRSKRRP